MWPFGAKWLAAASCAPGPPLNAKAHVREQHNVVLCPSSQMHIDRSSLCCEMGWFLKFDRDPHS